MWVVTIACSLCEIPNVLSAVSLAIVLVVTMLHVLNTTSKSTVVFLCFLTVLVACASYAFLLLFFFSPMKLPTFLTPLEWGSFVSTHTLRLACVCGSRNRRRHRLGTRLLLSLPAAGEGVRVLPVHVQRAPPARPAQHHRLRRGRRRPCEGGCEVLW